MRLLRARGAGNQCLRREDVLHRERAGEPGHPPGHQGFRQLADHPAALRQRRVRGWLGHHEGDAPVGRTAEAAGRAWPVGLSAIMSFVLLVVDVDCTPTETNPKYRAYLNDELFTERTWSWGNSSLEEMFQIDAPPGTYTIRYELVQPGSGQLSIKNTRITHGSARVIDTHTIEIHDESG